MQKQLDGKDLIADWPLQSTSRATLLQLELARILNTSAENVDVFTVLHSPKRDNQSLLDVRFSAHGSPYHSAVKLNRIISENQDRVSRLYRVPTYGL
jgi:hypothetical protein